jgi:hypothetical protein
MSGIRLRWYSVFVVFFAAILILGSGSGCNGNNADGCRENSDCAVTEYCEKAVGDCDGVGECLPSPLICPDLWAPVCGCDSVTYSNECEAAAVGVNIVLEGGCPPPPCTDNNECAVNEYCEKTVGDCDGTGECLPMPVTCIDIWDPVCGCDALTYGNACEAEAVGVNVASVDACPQSACNDNNDCTSALYCEKAVGDCNGVGECVAIPTTCIDLYDPVCGCNGTSYGNSCEAAATLVNVASQGQCP